MPPIDTTASFPLSPIQQGMLFHHLTNPHSGVDIEQIVGTLPEPVNREGFEAAWRAVAARHSNLRLSLRWNGDSAPEQQVMAELPIDITFEDWEGRGASDRAGALEAYLAEDRARGIDLAGTPLWRVRLFRFGEAEYRFVWTFHHILMDGRSFPIILEDLFRHYEAAVRGEALVQPAVPAYAEFISWLSRRDGSGDRAFWKEYLEGFDTPTRVADAAGEEAESGRGTVGLELTKQETDGLRELAERHGVTLNTLVQAAWAVLLARFSGESDVVFGATRVCRHSTIEGADSVAGVFINTLPVRVRAEGSREVGELLSELRSDHVRVRAYEHTPLVDIQKWSGLPAGTPLFESIIVFDHARLGVTMRTLGERWARRDFVLHERTNYPLTLYGYGESRLLFELAHDCATVSTPFAAQLAASLGTILRGLATGEARFLREIPTVSASETRAVAHWNATDRPWSLNGCIHELFAEQVEHTPVATAVRFGEATLSYEALDRRATALAAQLRAAGVGPDVAVGLAVERSLDLPVALLGILKAGGAYVPLDPSYPTERLSYMLEDSGARVLVTQGSLRGQFPDFDGTVIAVDEAVATDAASASPAPSGTTGPANLAYIIYTSGSTGRPKGVMIEHRNVVNFFHAMDERLDLGERRTWLALTSLSFDISVLELLWTLTRGFEVVIYADGQAQPDVTADVGAIGFSLFYFAANEAERPEDRYRLLLEGARFADRHGFEAVWTPERHFHAFGGLYPNPSVTGAAVAAVTERVGIRAGSVVLPLHHPIRVAEEWSLVDNISRGRVGLSVASGWHPDDFVLAPENHADRKAKMFESLGTLRRLWRGEAVAFPGPNGKDVTVRTLPRPIQKELPVWVTTAGNVETYEQAGAAGAHVLTHLLGQSIDEVRERVAAYRRAWRTSGHAGDGHVTLMVHTFVGDDDDAVRELVREPMKNYLRTAVGLIKNFAGSWTAYSRRAKVALSAAGDEFQKLSPEDLDALLDFSFERYYETSGLFGSVESCMRTVSEIRSAGVDEIACLIDFGVDGDLVLRHLEQLNALKQACAAVKASPTRGLGLAEQMRTYRISHLQCTPSRARLLLADPAVRTALADVDNVLVGGEALPGSLARELRAATGGRVINMYGPTETTIWSSTQTVDGDVKDATVPIGLPIGNTTFHVLDRDLDAVPVGAPGELCIGGAGVARGYHARPELTAERFVSLPGSSKGRLYRTGDLVRRRADGVLEFLGRIDHQVKIRGHRIELSEIEAILGEHPGVRNAVVVARKDRQDDVRIVGYIVPANGGNPELSAEVRVHAARLLPEIMVPAAIVLLDALPLTPNGKVDRKALPAPESVRTESTIVAPPATPMEETIAGIWRDVLGLEQVGVTDNFFDLGGHSLLTVQVHGRLRQAFQRDLPITDLFRFPTIRSLVEHLRDESKPSAAIEGVQRGAARRAAMARGRSRA